MSASDNILTVLKPDGYSGVTMPHGVALTTGYSVMHPAGTGFLIAVIFLIIWLLVIALVKPQWARIKAADGTPTDAINWPLVLITGIVIAVIIWLIVWAIMRSRTYA